MQQLLHSHGLAVRLQVRQFFACALAKQIRVTPHDHLSLQIQLHRPMAKIRAPQHCQRAGARTMGAKAPQALAVERPRVACPLKHARASGAALAQEVGLQLSVAVGDMARGSRSPMPWVGCRTSNNDAGMRQTRQQTRVLKRRREHMKNKQTRRSTQAAPDVSS